MLLDDRRAMLRKLERKTVVVFVEKPMRPGGSIVGDFWKIVFGDWELTCSANWRGRVRRSGVNVFGELERSCSVIRR